MESAVAYDLHYPAAGACQLRAQRHPPAESQAASGEPDIGLRAAPWNLVEHGKGIADGFVDDDVVPVQDRVQFRADIVGGYRIDLPRLGRGGRDAMLASLA